ncbi:MAG: hypothetical protein IPI78_16045 [Chitinophagaceae bacterium]|nr:hypothetical protein [Chitinophagaceae bacterium]
MGYSTSYHAWRYEGSRSALGYSHGYSRSMSNTGKVLVRGVEATVVGIVNIVQVQLMLPILKGGNW